VKIKNVPVQEKKVRLDFTLVESEAARFEAYRQYVATSTGTDISQRELLALVVVQFMDEDKDFAKALAAQGRATPLQPSHGILRGAGQENNVTQQENS
jgi:hypothetical protein